MINQEIPIEPGMNVRHDDGLTYQVDGVRRSTVGWEETHKLGGMMIDYTQLEDGDFPAGTEWQKDEEGFRKYFTPEG
jgi:hypothetical protein